MHGKRSITYHEAYLKCDPRAYFCVILGARRREAEKREGDGRERINHVTGVRVEIMGSVHVHANGESLRIINV